MADDPADPADPTAPPLPRPPLARPAIARPAIERPVSDALRFAREMAAQTANQPRKPSRNAGQFGQRTRPDHKTVAARGGRRAHQLGVAHEYTPEEASAAAQRSVDQRVLGNEQRDRRQRIANRRARAAAGSPPPTTPEQD